MQHENLSDHLSPLIFVIGSGGERLRHFVARSIHLLFHCLPPVKLHEKLSDHPSISSLDTFFNNNDNSREKGSSKVSICSLLISMCNWSRSFRPFHLVLWVRKRAQDAKAKRNRHKRLFMWFWLNNNKHTIRRNKFWANHNLQNRHSVIGKQITNLSVGCAHFQREHRS